MSSISTVCPHCGARVFVPGGSIDCRLRCPSCSGEFTFMSDAGGRLFKTACPHCGTDAKVGENNFDTPLHCANCGGEFTVSKAQEEIKLYHTYAAVLWGLFTGMGPFLTGWFIKKNFDELGMPEEAEEYGKFIKTCVIYCILSSIAGVLIGMFLVPFVIAAADSNAFMRFLSKFVSFCTYIPAALVGIYYWVFFIRYAIRSSKAEADCLSYHKYKSTWPPVLFMYLVINALLLPALIIIAVAAKF